MSYVEQTTNGSIATLTLQRGKVNAIDENMVGQLSHHFESVQRDESVRSIILTGTGSFFSFGFDIPHFMDHSEERFTNFLNSYSDLYRKLFLYPKPIVAALNGHAVAGGCILALCADKRIVASGKMKVALNEITFGASIFANLVDILSYWLGGRLAEEVLIGGKMYSAEEARQIGLIDRIVPTESLLDEAAKIAEELAAKDATAYQAMKNHLRGQILANSEEREATSISEFVRIWYSDEMRQRLAKIEIRS